MDTRKVYIETYGCQMNLADTELIVGLLKPHGYEPTQVAAQADVILLNTCAIREHAEERVLGRLGELVRHKTRRPGVLLGLTGCMAQHHRERLLDKAPFLDLVLGPDAYRTLPALLVQEDKDEPLVSVRLDRDETYADITPARGEGVRAWVTVMRGCDKFCTFCIVPYVRGRERSIPLAALLAQVRELAAQGYKEVVYLGQTVNAYRDGDRDFADLLRRTAEVDGIERIRFTSPHPADMSERVVEAMATCPKVAPYLHLPLQAASDRVLARMARGYTVEQYAALVERLRAAVPRLALSTDIIVGFPGEEEIDLRATYDFMAETRYDSAFMFKYSAREGTKAYKWTETLSEEEKGRRLQEVIALQERISAEINQQTIGQTVEVLIEGPAKRQEGWLAGKSGQFKTVVFPSTGARPGEIVPVRVVSATAHTLVGEARL
ncbi:MAG TPA: tRNA (N6-isopentenyl adenosine(37)-C2)-methylthiotransferase MiaB [Candidatus Binatia bacterium]|jgi:tRNA-2-methylthio-N6-dimethylallyladenosine synthase|nr:tRNA (N6-isopentenyl adenosine(37)-C2)-methylthiotransferase MiaB [Candidatus Binatia bacterium]